MKKRIGSIIVAFLFIVIATVMFYLKSSTIDGIRLGGFTINYEFLLGMVLIFIGFTVFLIRGNLEEMQVLGVDSCVLALPYLMSVFFSFVIWIIHFSEFRQMTRGFFLVVYQVIGLLVSLSYVSVFRKNAIKIMIVSMALANVYIFILAAQSTGRGAYFFRDFWILLSTFGGTTPPLLRAMEKHDLTFAFGVLFMYYLVKDKKKSDYIWMLITLFFFLLGLKRIAFVGLAVGAVFVILFKKRSRLVVNGAIITLAILFIVSAWAYLYAIKSGLFAWIIDRLGIDDSARVIFYTFVDDQYTLEPFYQGRGLGYLSSYLDAMKASGELFVNAVHNDFLLLYIDLGFWGFLAWIWVYWISRNRYFMRRKPVAMAIMAAMILVYDFATYFTDNTYYYYRLNIASFAAILAANYDTGVIGDKEGRKDEQ